MLKAPEDILPGASLGREISRDSCTSAETLALMIYDSGVSDPGFDLRVTVNWSALQERLSRPGGGVTKLVTLAERHTLSLVVGLYVLNVNWTWGYHNLHNTQPSARIS